MHIHPVRTGTVRLKRRYVTTRWRRQSLRFLDVLADRRWTEPLPIYAWLVDHPEGPIVVDTGATVACYDERRRGLASRLVTRRTAWFDVAPEEEVGPQLRSMGVDPDEVRWVVQTHLAPDHADGVSYFRNAEVVVSRREWEASEPTGRTWPSWVRRRLVDYDGAFGPFPESHVLAEGVVVVATPGATPGHQSVVCLNDECAAFLGGDATFTQAQLLSAEVGGGVDDYRTAAASIARIRAFATETPTVYLPAHDPESPHRLRRRETVPLAPSVDGESPDASSPVA
jgi:glyoxylase-like metal-dependent hydrolase (beta-lactamase superfamily II)